MDANIESAIRENLKYDSSTGMLLWKSGVGGRGRKREEAGHREPEGRIIIVIAGEKIRAHRIVWFLSFGTWPEKEIDHIDGDPSNNKIENLRDVSVRENQGNQKMHRSGKLVGAKYNKKRHRNPWTARIKVNGEDVYLGCFPTEQEAHGAYVKAVEELS